MESNYTHPTYYFDYAARSLIRPEALVARAAAAKLVGNADSPHSAGHLAKQAWNETLSQLAQLLSCQPTELTVTASATESAFLALAGIFSALPGKNAAPDILTTPLEHPAVRAPLDQLSAQGATVRELALTSEGLVRPEVLRAALRPETQIVTIIAASNEIGSIQSLRQLVQVIRAHEQTTGQRIYIHTDASQLAPWVHLLPHELDVDALTLSGSKLGTVANVGLLYLRANTPFNSPMKGGGQQYERRGGTLPVAEALELAAALQITWQQLAETRMRVTQFREQIRRELEATFPNGITNGNQDGLPNFLSFTVPGLNAESAIYALDAQGIYCAAGSACSTTNSTARRQLFKALGRPSEEAENTLRFSLGWATHENEVNAAMCVIPATLKRILTQEDMRQKIRSKGHELALKYTQKNMKSQHAMPLKEEW